MSVIGSYLLLTIYYTVIGLMIELLFTGFSKLPFIWDKVKSEEDRLLGYVPMWMIPIYSILLPLFYLPLYFLLIYYHVPFYIRFLIWTIGISGFEALSGWFYDKGLLKITKGKFSIRPWDYSACKDSLFNGYTRWLFVPLWGIIGMLMEFVTFIAFQSLALHKELIIKFFKLYF